MSSRFNISTNCLNSDNFQGEEAGIVIISLVRSNEQGKVGFLKTKNRVNVLLRYRLRSPYRTEIISNTSL